MARLISMRILTDHACTKDRQFLIRFGDIGKHTIQFLGETFLTSYQSDQTVQILRHGPEILPTIALANIFRIIIGAEISGKVSFLITRLHKGSCRIVHIMIIL